MLATRWEPFVGMNRLQDEVSRWIHDLDRRARHYATTGYPPFNLWEVDDAYFLEAELPGLALDDIEIVMSSSDELTVKGNRNAPEPGSVTWHRQERGFGDFARQIRLPTDVDAEQVSACLTDGILTVTLPKCEAVKPRKISVTSN